MVPLLPFASRGSHWGGGDDKDLSQPVFHVGLTQPRLECGLGWGREEEASAGWGAGDSGRDFAEDA